MVSGDKFVRNEIKEIAFYIALAIIMAIILPIFLGFVLGGFELSFQEGRPIEFGDLLVSFMIYYIFTIASLALILFPIMSLVLIRRGQHPATQPNPSFFRIFTVSFIFAPEQNGFLYYLFETTGLKGRKNPLKGSLSILRVFAISILVFSLLGIFQISFPQLQVVGIPQLVVQQITPVTEVLFSAEPAAWSETMTLLFIFSLLMGMVAWFNAKFQLGKGTFFLVGAVVIAPLMGLAWMGFHSLVYGNSEAALLATFIFGFFGSLLTLAFGTFIPFYVWHFFNNVFAKLSEIAVTQEDVIFISLIAWFAFLIFYLALEFIFFKFGRNRKDIEIE